MGCDIHMVLEKEISGKWVGLHAYPHLTPSALLIYKEGYESMEGAKAIGWIANNRNYKLFGAIASVRRESPFGYEPRGLPDDVSDLAAAFSEEYGEEGHSHSWLLLPDFLKCYGWAKHGEASDEHTAASLAAVKGEMPYIELAGEVTGLKYIDEYENDDAKAAHKYRIVFWFDN
jgi:hypothetical protein